MPYTFTFNDTNDYVYIKDQKANDIDTSEMDDDELAAFNEKYWHKFTINLSDPYLDEAFDTFAQYLGNYAEMAEDERDHAPVFMQNMESFLQVVFASDYENTVTNLGSLQDNMENMMRLCAGVYAMKAEYNTELNVQNILGEVYNDTGIAIPVSDD